MKSKIDTILSVSILLIVPMVAVMAYLMIHRMTWYPVAIGLSVVLTYVFVKTNKL
jgi:hypothetical protein